MTISPLADETARDDADLARAAASGDRAAFAAIYDRYADRLFDFCIGMLRDRDAAADCVQDAFLTAATRLAQLREHERLRSWLYAIARNQALNRIQQRRREHLSEDFPEMASNTPDLDVLAARTELTALINDACGGLSDRDRTVYELAYRHGLDGPELADALGVSHTNANTLMVRLRDTIERSLGAMLVSRRAKAVPTACPELVALLGDWDGRFTVLTRKRVARHIDNCPECDSERRRMVNPVALLGGAPVFISAPAGLRENILARLPAIAHAGAHVAAAGAHADLAQRSWWPPRNFNTSDLAGPQGGPAHSPHPGAGATKTIGPPQAERVGPTTPTNGTVPDKAIGAPTAGGPTQLASPTTPSAANKQVGPEPTQIGGAPTVEAIKLGPKFPGGSAGPPGGPKALNTDSAHGQLGGRARTALLVAMVLLALGTVAVLGTVLLHQMWPPASPAQTPTPAPAATNVRMTATSAAPPPTSMPAATQTITTQSRPPTRSPATSDYTAPSPASEAPAPAAPPVTAATSTVATPTSQLPPPPPAPVPIPNSGTGSLPGPDSSNSSGSGTPGGSANQAPVSSGGSSTGSSSSGSSGTGSPGGSPPVITHKVFGGSGPNLNNCPVITGCPPVSNTHGIH